MIIVTTPTGNVGSDVVRLLSEQELRPAFRAVARRPEKVRQIFGEDIECTRLDFDDPTTWSEALEGISVLFLLVPRPDPRVIRSQFLPFIDAAVKAGCQHIVYLSVPGADRAKIIPHAQVEQHIMATGIAYTILRPAYFMQNFIREEPTHGVDIAQYHEIFIPAGKGRMALIDARDVAEVVAKVCVQPEAHKNQAYKLTGSEAPTFYEMADTFSKVLGEPIRYANPSLPHFWYRLRRRGVSWMILIVMSIEYTLTRLGHSGGTTDTLEQLLGHAPRTLAQFIADNRERWITREWV